MGKVFWNENLPPDDMELLSALLMEEAMLERIETVIRERRFTEGVTITLSGDFDKMCDALEQTEGMTVREAYEHLRSAGAGIPMDSQLQLWWLRNARDRLVACAERQGELREVAGSGLTQ